MRWICFLVTVVEIFSLPLTEFNFLRSECLSNNFSDHSSHHLVGNLLKSYDTLFCLDSNGIGSFELQSINDLSLLLHQVGQSNSFSIEVWIQPQRQNNNFVMMSFSKPGATADEYQYNIQFIQGLSITNSTSNTTEFIVELSRNRASVGDLLSTGQIPISIIDDKPSLIHIVASLVFSETALNNRVYYTVACYFWINGVAAGFGVYASSTNLSPSLWTASNQLLFIPPYSGSGDTTLWEGNLYYFAMYDEMLNETEVVSKFHSGIANSDPVVKTKIVTVQENGEMGNHINDPMYYNYPIPNWELQIIDLDAFDFDDQPICPNYDGLIGPTMQVYLTQLPFNGTGVVYHVNGSEIKLENNSRVLIPLDPTTGAYSVRFRPPYNVYSIHNEIIAIFSFIAVDGITGVQSADVGRVYINVSHVDRPPIAYSNQSIVEAEQSQLLQFWGSDPDSKIIGIVINKFPTFGYLSQAFQNQTVLFDLNYNGTIYMEYPMIMNYFYNGQQSLLDTSMVDPVVGFDSICFTLVDFEGRQSVPVYYNLTILTSLVAIPSVLNPKYPSATQGSSSNITMYGNDLADIKRSLQVRLLTQPSHGILMGYGALLEAGDTVHPVDYLHYDFVAQYVGEKFYFTSPSISWNGTNISTSLDSFDYVVFTDSGAESTKATQFISILNINDPTDIGFKQPSNGYLNVIPFGLNDDQHTVLTFEGFSCLEFDKNVDVIKASLTTSSGGKLTLNSDYLNIVDFNSRDYCDSCVGDGTLDTTMVFVGTPYAIEMVLNGMTYQNDRETIDYLNVTLFDGIGEECFPLSFPNSGSVFTGCFTSTVIIKIVVSDNPSSLVNNRTHSISDRLYYIAIGLIITFLLAICRCCYLKLSKPKLNSSNKLKKEVPVGSKYETLKSSRKKKSPKKRSNENDEESIDAPSINNIKLAKYDMSLRDSCRNNSESSGRKSCWTAHIHRSGKIYYYNVETRQSSWTRPIEYNIL